MCRLFSLFAPALFITVILNCNTRDSNVRVIKAGVTHGPNHSFTLALNRFGRDLEKTSNGRYQVRVYCSAQLGGEKEMQEMLTIGTLEMTVTGLLNTYEPLFAIFELPYLYRDRDHVFAVNQGQVMDQVASSLLPRGLRLIGFYENGFRHITNSVRPIETPEDVAGLMIRTPENPAQIETFRALGAIPTPLSFSELYTALLQGVVDGQENPLQNIWYGNLHEAQKYLAVTGHIYNSAYCLISERFWNSLPVPDREQIRDTVARSSRWQLDYMEKLDRELAGKLQEAGMTFSYPDLERFRRACQPAYEAIYARLGERARKYVAEIIDTY